MKDALYYNFRITPETAWLIGQTVLGAIVVDLAGKIFGLSQWPTLDTWQAWLSAALLVGLRTGVGALLAVITGGGFQLPGVSAKARNEPPPGGE